MPIKSKLLRRFYNPVFIETGTMWGYGIIEAVWVGFPKIYSIELSDYYYDRACESFINFPNVELIKGNSGEELVKLLKDISEQSTFWLDAHYSEQGTANGPSPLFDELKAIREHKIKTHTILIDDISDYDLDEVKSHIQCSKFEVQDNILICLP